MKARLTIGIWFILTLAACDHSTSETSKKNNQNIQNQDKTENYTIGPIKRFELYSSDGSLNICEMNQYDSDGYLLTSHEITNNSLAPDLTCDDAITSGRLTEYTYSADKTKLYSSSETDTGITDCSTSTFNSDNKELSKKWYNSSLTHQTCDEDNDKTTMIVKSTYVNKLQNTYSRSRNNGADNEWGTQDDILDTYWKYSHDVERNSASIKASTDYGNDMIWGTEDDVIGKITTITTLAPGIYSVFTNTLNGKITSIAKATYENKVLIKHIEYSGPGEDNNWETFDDNPIYIAFYY